MAHSFDDLIRAYARHVDLPWEGGLSSSERVWILWYGQALERRVSSQIYQFETITRNSGRGWVEFDVGPLFGTWVAEHRYFTRLTKRPSEVTSILPAFATEAAEVIEAVAGYATANDVVVLKGIGSLFGLTSVSRLIEQIAPVVPGRLLVTFPGRYQAGAYSLLDARESWNYHATPIPPVSYL